jgi:hypothetical protein
MTRRYIYKGDRLSDIELKGTLCSAVLRPDGKTIRGPNGLMLVRFDSGREAVVIGRLLRKI